MTLPKTVIPSSDYMPPGLTGGVIEETIDMSTAAAYFALGTQRPANSAIAFIAIKVPNTLTAATAVKFGLGNASDPDAYYLSAGLTTASSTYKVLEHADTNVTSAETLRISACATDGSAAGTIGGGADDYLRVRVGYKVVEGF